MRYLILGFLLILSACSVKEYIDLSYKGPESGKCYAFDDEAIKIIGTLNDVFYYKHSWNSQDKVFNRQVRTFRGYEISCDRSGYEFEVLAYALKSAQDDIRYLKELTEPLRKKTK